MSQTSFRTRLQRLLSVVLEGECRPAEEAPPDKARCGRLLQGEDGMVTWATLVAIVFLCFLAALVFNVGKTIHQKVETQNAADSVAYSSTVWMARGMNATTAANHMMGELTALYVLHHALCGEWLDLHPNNDKDKGNDDGWRMKLAEQELEWIHRFAKWFSNALPVDVPDTVYDAVKKAPHADQESTVFEAKLRLKLLLCFAYQTYIAGGIVYYIPFPGCAAAGEAIMWAAYGAEWYIYKEYRILDGVEFLAGNLVPAKRQIPTVLDALWTYEKTIVKTTPAAASGAAKPVAARNQCRGAAGVPVMPLVNDPVDMSDVAHCQLMRAQTPWMRHWGKTITDFLSNVVCGAPVSGTPHFYVYWCEEYSDRIVRWFVADTDQEQSQAPKMKEGETEKGRGYKLFVVQGLDKDTSKGSESWTQAENSSVADDQFCLLGVAQQPSPPAIAAHGFFRQENPDGVVCWSQGMVYNANHQDPPDQAAKSGDYQPRVGWDTLNWNSGGPTSNAFEFRRITSRLPDPFIITFPPYFLPGMTVPIVDGGVDLPSIPGYPNLPDPEPLVRLNWQAKLVPVTARKLVHALPAVTISDPTIGKYMLMRVGVGLPVVGYSHELTTH